MTQYVYILLNPALKDLVKIGRTSRTPEERAQELSAATGVPQPFVVAYESLVSDGALAERLIHDELSREGYRPNSSREFFEVPLKIAVALVDRICRTLPVSDFDAVSIEPDDSTNRSTEFLLKGQYHLRGTDDDLQDFDLAKQYFERAVSLGEIDAYQYLASMHLWGLGTQRNPSEAYRLLQEGGRKGDAQCFLRLWEIYAGKAFNALSEEIENGKSLSNPPNAEVAFSWYLNAIDKAGAMPDAEGMKAYVGWALALAPGISAMNGRHTASVMEHWVSSCKQITTQFHEARVGGLPIESVVDAGTGKQLSMKLLMELHELLSLHGRPLTPPLQAILVGISRDDLEYAFSRLPPSRMMETVARFVPYLAPGLSSAPRATPTSPAFLGAGLRESPRLDSKSWVRRMMSRLKLHR